MSNITSYFAIYKAWYLWIKRLDRQTEREREREGGGGGKVGTRQVLTFVNVGFRLDPN